MISIHCALIHSLQILMSVKQELMSVMTMQHAVTQRGVMSVPATQDMVAMEYLAQVYCMQYLLFSVPNRFA